MVTIEGKRIEFERVLMREGLELLTMFGDGGTQAPDYPRLGAFVATKMKLYPNNESNEFIKIDNIDILDTFFSNPFVMTEIVEAFIKEIEPFLSALQNYRA